MNFYLTVFAATTDYMSIRQLICYVAAGIYYGVNGTFFSKRVRNEFLLIQFFPVKISLCQLNATNKQFSFFALWHLMILFIQYIPRCPLHRHTDIIDIVFFS